MNIQQLLTRGYVALLAAAFLGILSTTLQGPSLRGHVLEWIALVILFGLTEYGQVYFHDRGARFGLTGSESVLFVMIYALSLPQVLWGVALAVGVERLVRGTSGLKLVFNVAQYGCSVAAAAAIWRWGGDPRSGFTARNAFVATVSVLVFAVLTHILTSIVISLVERRSLFGLSRNVAPATLLNLLGSVVLGLLFAAAYSAASWTSLLFPLPILGMYVGYTAILRTQRERDRVENLYAATRALASSRIAGESIIEFLKAVSEIVASPDMRLVLQGKRKLEVWQVHSGPIVAAGTVVPGDVHSRLFDLVVREGSMLLGEEADEHPGWEAELLSDLGARTLIASPISSEEGPVRGCLVAAGRIGAEDFSSADVRLLEALANELLVSLDSYRLFNQIAEERERFGRIFSGSQEGICLLDAEGVVRAWNPALEKISGHYAADMMDQVWSDRVLIRDRDQRRLTKLDLVGVRPADEVELVTKEGPSRWVTMVSGPVGETEGGGWVVLVRDVTAAHEVEVAKSDFLSTISHELRTPLTTIKGSLQVLGRGRDKIPENIADQMIDVTTRGAERLEKLVMNLLAVSQIESGSIAVFPDEISLEDVVEDRYASLLKDHPRSRLVLPENPIPVRADRERLSQTVDHLLENALKFGGRDGEIKVSITHHKGFARLSVSDDGPGIPSTDQERIFERFVRLGEVLTRETQGAGIGLFIAKSAVEAMGGRIWVESTPGEGATFNVEVPLARPMALAGEASV